MYHLRNRMGKRPLAFAAGVALAAAALVVGTSAAYAQDNRPGAPENGVVCYYNGQPYSPGAKIKMDDGTVLTCGKDGNWSRQRSPVRNIPSGPLPQLSLR